jgi:hypothetical protein
MIARTVEYLSGLCSEIYGDRLRPATFALASPVLQAIATGEKKYAGRFL